MARRINAKLVLELLGKGMTGREIYRTRRIAQQSVKKVREAAEEKGVTWEDVNLMGDQEVYDLLFPERAELEAATAQADYDYVHSELQRDGVTLLILWEEYRDQAMAEDLVLKSYTTFCRGYRGYVASHNVTNHLEHKPGQVMEVDWNGITMRLVDEFTGEVTKVAPFYSCSGASGISLAALQATMTVIAGGSVLCFRAVWGPHDDLRGCELGAALEWGLRAAVLLQLPEPCRRQLNGVVLLEHGYAYMRIDTAGTPGYLTAV